MTGNEHRIHPAQEELLSLIAEYRFASSHQLTRRTHHLYGSRRSAIRQTLRHLRALHDQRLVARLERRVGGWQGGSQSSVWTLSTSGQRFLTGKDTRLRPHRYSTSFLQHTLAVTETAVLLHEASALFNRELAAHLEPGCWRPYLDRHGMTTALKPDLAATVTSSEFVDRYFIEVDRATENPARVIRKCWQYETYRRTSTEQEQHGVYPAVIWIVPHQERKMQLSRAIDQEPKLPKHLFTVITPDELTALIRNGPSPAV